MPAIPVNGIQMETLEAREPVPTELLKLREIVADLIEENVHLRKTMMQHLAGHAEQEAHAQSVARDTIQRYNKYRESLNTPPVPLPARDGNAWAGSSQNDWERTTLGS
jgi:hypothetical protein